MHITGFIIKNHNFYKDFDLKFTFSTQKIPANFIIYAGENGTGKTQILNIIYYVTKLKIPQFLKNAYVELSFKLNSSESNSLLLRSDSFRKHYHHNHGIYEVKLIKEIDTQSVSIYFPTVNAQYKQNKFTKDDLKAIKSLFGVILYDNTNKSKNKTKTNSIFKESVLITDGLIKKDDTYLKRLLKDFLNDHHEMKRLKDNSAFFTKDSRTISQKIIRRKSDISRINNFFIFEHEFIQFIHSTNEVFRLIKSLLRVELDMTNHSYYFTKNGNDRFPFKGLSAGEKRILTIFNLTHSLQGSRGNIVLIDEPEIGLHTNWQKLLIRILQIFNPETQFIISSHSPYLIFDNSTLSKKIIINKFRNSKVTVSTSLKDSSKYENQEQIAASAFNLKKSLEISSKILILVEGRTDEIILNKTLNAFNLKSRFDIQWIGSYNKLTKAEEFTGEDNLRIVLKTLKNNTNFINRKICCLFDNDSSTNTQFITKNLIVYKFKSSENELSFKGIESLMNLKNWPITTERYLDIRKFNEGKIIKKEIRKMLLANDINNLCSKKASLVLAPINDELLYLSSLFKKSSHNSATLPR